MISLDGWRFDEYFAEMRVPSKTPDFILQARGMVRSCGIENHVFFDFCKENKGALIEWTKQECIITNHFSLSLFSLLGLIRNVHLRSMLIPVLAGEHSPLKDGIAYGSHPNLLARLIDDLGIDTDSLNAENFTVEFVDLLFSENYPICYRFGVLGVGNEALLVPEYKAVSLAFDHHYPRGVHRPFLTANIEEDRIHSKVMEDAAMLLCNDAETQDSFIQGARDGIQARFRYYDKMLDFLKKIRDGRIRRALQSF